MVIKEKYNVNENGKRIIKRHWGEGELITSGKDNELNADIDDNECIYLSKDGRYIISDKKNDGSLHAATGDNYKKSLVADLRKSSKIPVKNDNE
ncbi:hypothetical protein [Shewanella marina]|uniref:hypothetical protein n=1 Tax=Shewanella marina TaxID=487319 RepID=UPI00046FAF8B|nr:hypothetical protein [Shewanella marina]